MGDGNKTGNPDAYSLQLQCHVQADKLNEAVFMLEQICLNEHNTTKTEMRRTIKEATKLILETRKWLVG